MWVPGLSFDTYSSPAWVRTVLLASMTRVMVGHRAQFSSFLRLRS